MNWFKKAVAAAKYHDPAARSTLDVILTYPGVHALFWHRLSHQLYRRRCYLIAKLHAQFWRWLTGIEIHPGAQIAEGVFIDHGMGVVIGETAVIEQNVVLYHGVTLGATTRERGRRHPHVKQGTIIYANAQILGPVVVGERVKVGACSVVLQNVPDDATVVGIPAKVVRIKEERIHYE